MTPAVRREPGRARLVLAAALIGVAACWGPAVEEAVEETPPPSEGVFGRVPAAAGGVPSLVMLSGDGGGDPAPSRAVIDQLGLQFTPTRLVIAVGGTVDFTNSESIAHNVQVTGADDGRSFFSADTPPDGSAPFTFEEPGGYDITCEIHPGMRAFVFVTDAPYTAFADDDGAFAMPEVPPGDYTLTVWSVDPDARSERSVTVRPGEATEVNAAPLG